MHKSKAQGTIEYLIIIAIVITMSLLIVGFMTGIMGNNISVGSNLKSVQTQTGELAITEAITNPNGELTLEIKGSQLNNNNITKIIVDDYEEIFVQNNNLISDDKKIFSVISNQQCDEGTSITKNITIEYTNQHGLNKKQTTTLTIPCQIHSIKNQNTAQTNTFNFKIETTTPNQTFTFGIDNATNLEIDWGDARGWETLENGSGLRSNTYLTPNEYLIRLKGSATRLYFYSTTGTGGTPYLLKDILTPISNGVTGITSATNMFRDCNNITTFTAENFFDETSKNVTNFSAMSRGAITANPNTTNWDTSKVTSMGEMFYGARSANPNTTNWNTSNVTNMRSVFYGATNASPNTSNWNTHKVTDMYGMFWSATNANPNVSDWNTSNVTNISYMFLDARNANPNTSNWDTSKVTTLTYLFAGTADITSNLSDWNINRVTSMYRTFYNTTNVNPDISDWDTSNVTNMGEMFNGAKDFNQDLSSWNVTNVTSCTNFSKSTSNWTLPKPDFTQCTP
ncbi:MAG: BspA family leucine-rich repeat surface protein [Candidatus ainarchaeum sp.]|nr:BspA family leucine-rich repeat surface protein [Candidatus ainarchaeum sp.]